MRNTISGDVIARKLYENVLIKYSGSYAPIIIAKPDIILVVEDYKRIINELLLIAVKLKYFKEFKQNSRRGCIGRWAGAQILYMV